MKALSEVGTASQPEAVDPMQDYVARVRELIASRQRYPALARRRAEQGLVQVRITIDERGRIANLDLDGDASLHLMRATREAVRAVDSFPAPPRGRVLIEVPVRWRLVP